MPALQCNYLVSVTAASARAVSCFFARSQADVTTRMVIDRVQDSSMRRQQHNYHASMQEIIRLIMSNAMSWQKVSGKEEGIRLWSKRNQGELQDQAGPVHAEPQHHDDRCRLPPLREHVSAAAA